MPFERLHKEARTLDIGLSGPVLSDPAYVGLVDYDRGTQFQERFQTIFAPRLGKRADGFSAIFDALQSAEAPLTIVETGCLRVPNNWEGDGQSTFLFDALAEAELALRSAHMALRLKV